MREHERGHVGDARRLTLHPDREHGHLGVTSAQGAVASAAGVVAAAEVGELEPGRGRDEQVAGVRIVQRGPGAVERVRVIEDGLVAGRLPAVSRAHEAKLLAVAPCHRLVVLEEERDLRARLAVQPGRERRRVARRSRRAGRPCRRGWKRSRAANRRRRTAPRGRRRARRSSARDRSTARRRSAPETRPARRQRPAARPRTDRPRGEPRAPRRGRRRARRSRSPRGSRRGRRSRRA